MAGYSGTPLLKKLGIKDGHRVGLFQAPAGIPCDLAEFGDLRGTDPYDVMVAFCATDADLLPALGAAVPRLVPTGGLWLAWPKKSSPLHVDLAREPVRAAGLATGLVDNKVCAIDADWSGLRFVVRLADRP